EITIASPDGGPVSPDALSDPRDDSRWSADDLISMGALNTPELVAQLENTPAINDLDLDAYDALVICGGQGPMFQFREHVGLQAAIARFYAARKITGGLINVTCARIAVN